MNKIDNKDKETIQFDGLSLISNSISSFIITSACKISDILDFCKEQVDKAKFLIGEKKRFNKEDVSLKKNFIRKIKETTEKVDKSIRLVEQSRRLPDISGEEKEEDI